VLAGGTEDPMTLADARLDANSQKHFEEPLKALFDLGVPVVCAAGNYGDKPNRQNIDSRPAVYATPDFPLITVGAANYKGESLSMSQKGEHLTIYAPGDLVEAQHIEDFQSRLFIGTSIGKRFYVPQ
jgi:hypothetical protein